MVFAGMLSPDRWNIARKITDNFACDNQPCHRRDKGGAAGDVPAVGAFMLGARRADTVGAAADRHILNGANGRLLRIDDL